MSFSVFSVDPTEVDCVSTRGDSAVTVTFSLSDASCRSALTVSVCRSASTMFARV